MASTTTSKNSNGDDDDDDDNEKQLFFTTSDLMQTLNASLQQQQQQQTKPSSAGFELQRRLPDGSTRKASPSEVSVADLQSKFQQVAAEVADLPTYEKKLEWAELQRKEGNRLYNHSKKYYKEALDVYLTCLIVKPTKTTVKGEEDDDVLHHQEQQFQSRVWWPVLNNLAQCTLKLGMYSKTETFCTMALEEETKVSDEEDAIKRLVSKVYFRRGKARRLLGKYQEARLDLLQARQLLLGMKEECETELLDLVDNELQLTDKSEKEGKRNRQRQERALQKLWKDVGNNSGTKPTASEKVTSSSSPLYADETSGSTTTRRRRNYSTLRAKQPRDDDDAETDNNNNNTEHYPMNPLSSYVWWRYYLSMVGRVAEALLIMTGGSMDDDDDDDDNNEKEK